MVLLFLGPFRSLFLVDILCLDILDVLSGELSPKPGTAPGADDPHPSRTSNPTPGCDETLVLSHSGVTQPCPGEGQIYSSVLD